MSVRLRQTFSAVSAFCQSSHAKSQILKRGISSVFVSLASPCLFKNDCSFFFVRPAVEGENDPYGLRIVRVELRQGFRVFCFSNGYGTLRRRRPGQDRPVLTGSVLQGKGRSTGKLRRQHKTNDHRVLGTHFVRQAGTRRLLNPADSFMRLLSTRGWYTDALLPDRIQDAVGQETLRQSFDLHGRSVTRKQDHFIGVVAECRLRPRNPVNHQQIEVFLMQFFASVGEQILGFRGKADQHLMRPFP